MDYSAQTKIYTDLHGLNNLRNEAKFSKAEAIDEIAKQFEGMFLQMILKNMRETYAVFGKGLFNSNEMETYEELYDKQMALSLSERGLGLAEMISQQLKRAQGLKADTAEKAPQNQYLPLPHALPNNSKESANLADNKNKPGDLAALPMPFKAGENRQTESLAKAAKLTSSAFDSKLEFVQHLWHEAKPIAEKLGVDPKVLIAQAALETGWGKKVIKHANGNSSHNLFGIKAHGGWESEKVFVNTLEYRNGIARKERAGFRSYGSFRESFADYAQFLQNNPRYDQALKSVSNPHQFARELQRAGYATDPNYANKIISIMESDEFKSVTR
ncbi:MAG: flagellar assembly peptidoglycan hydrolase FlgJ [Legionellales bacterium]|nr:flagellar assembly peptidoglycan hydrolase FlgJ [Legionellales bacterium]